jgi:RNA polymerase sigma-70 factor (ECF subfamily)
LDPLDSATLARALAGERNAREEIARRACTLALRTATGVLGAREDARDISQDVGVDVLRELGKLREAGAFDAWVHRITVRRTMRHLRRRRLREWREPRTPDDAPERADPGAPTGSPERVALELALARALAELPARQQLAIVLRYMHDLSEAQIADALKCAPGTAAALLSRAREQLRRDPNLQAMTGDAQ